MKWRLTISAVFGLCACAGAEIGPRLGGYDIPHGAEVNEADWPLLIDVPEAPSPGTFTEAAPDPRAGAAEAARLRAEARRLRARAEALSEPVLSPAERARLGR